MSYNVAIIFFTILFFFLTPPELVYMTCRINMTTYVHIVELRICTKTVPHQGPLSHPLVLASKEALVEELRFWEGDDSEVSAPPRPSPMNSDVQPGVAKRTTSPGQGL